jgi:RNA polymerase sigma factor (TIGR02999 family)
MSEVTRILAAIEHGEPQAAEQLLPRIYDELRKLAAARIAQERPGQTLQATALVHEAYLRLVASPGHESGGAQRWDSRGHFFAAAAEAMRRILVDRARHKATEKHGGAWRRIEFDERLLRDDSQNARADLLSLDEALTELEQHDAGAARLVKLRYFAGLSHQEAAEAMGMTRRAADRLWAVARAWLFQRLGELD